MPDSSGQNRHFISLFLIIAIMVTIIIQLLSCKACSITIPDSIIIEFALLFVTILTFITAFKHYHIFVHLGLACGMYSLITNLSSQFMGGTLLITTFITPIFVIISLFFIITGVRISMKEYEKKVIRYRLQKVELNKRLTELSEMSMALDQANKKTAFSSALPDMIS